MYDTPNTNLLEETIKAIENSKHSVEDIHHVIVKNKENSFFNKSQEAVAITWEDFCEVAKYFNYYSGYGSEVVWLGCKVVFNDHSFLERRSYDGSEWWSYIEIPNLDVVIEKYDSQVMSINDTETEEEYNRLKEKARKIERRNKDIERDRERRLETKIIKEKLELESKPFTLMDFIK